jgi:hypothetical protein
MNPHLTEIAYILDRSGSMQPMQEPAVAAFNDFIKSQLDVPGDARLTLNYPAGRGGLRIARCRASAPRCRGRN